MTALSQQLPLRLMLPTRVAIGLRCTIAISKALFTQLVGSNLLWVGKWVGKFALQATNKKGLSPFRS
jgi:hypothetical protein